MAMRPNKDRLIWKVATLSPDLASFRYRALYPSLGLERLGYASVLTNRSEFDPEFISNCSALVITKSFSQSDIEYARIAHTNNIPVFFDLCDNIFIKEYHTSSGVVPSRILLRLNEYLSGVVVPTATLAEVVSREMGDDRPVFIVPDCCETPDLRIESLEHLAKCSIKNGAASSGRQANKFQIILASFYRDLFFRREMNPISGNGDSFKKEDVSATLKNEKALGPIILWFGNHGSPWGNFGISDILIFREALEHAAQVHSARLLVVSNNLKKYEALIKPLSIPSVYLEWSADCVETALRYADVVVAPNSRDSFALCKSPNRTLMSLAAGVPVVATATPALEDLRGAVWLDDAATGISRFLTEPALVKEYIAQGRKLIKTDFSLQAVAEAWQNVFARSQVARSGH